jgi:hypothetical protein
MPRLKKASPYELERGSASIFVDVTNGVLTVKHGTDKSILVSRPMELGEWDKMFIGLQNSFKKQNK